MISTKWIVQNKEAFKQNLINRNCFDENNFHKIFDLVEITKSLTSELQNLQNQRNINSRSFNGPDRQEIIQKTRDINISIESIEKDLKENEDQLNNILSNLPNILCDEVVIGKDEEDNLELKRYNLRLGKLVQVEYDDQEKTETHIINSKNQPLMSHDDILIKMGFLETKQTVKMSGSRFIALKSSIAKLERSLVSFMIDRHTERGFVEIAAPFLVKDHALYNAGQLPKFDQESFSTTNGYRLIPTSEVSLVNLHSDSILSLEDLPIRYVSYSPCFRAEAGAAGRDTKGMIRLHQFTKVELVSFTSQEKSHEEHLYILESAERILQLLDLPYRVMLLCSGDTGFHCSKTYDIEVWFPFQNKYREISSCSNCHDYQSRRLATRYKSANGNVLAHTLNGSGLPIQRLIAAIVENYMNYDEGYIKIPQALVSYYGSDRIIAK